MKNDAPTEMTGLRVTLDRLVYRHLDPEESDGKEHAFVYFLSIHNDADCAVTPDCISVPAASLDPSGSIVPPRLTIIRVSSTCDSAISCRCDIIHANTPGSTLTDSMSAGHATK